MESTKERGEARRGAGPAYRIVTGRLVIRCWEPRDAPLLQRAVDQSLEHLRPWMPWALREPVPLEDRVQWLRSCRGKFDLGTDFVYGIFSADEGEVVGGTGLHTRAGPHAREIGYWISAGAARHGYATEASAALTRVAFLVDRVKRVEIHCDPRNVASAGVAQKLGFLHEATLLCRIEGSDGRLHDSMLWTMTQEAFPASVCAGAAAEAFDAAGVRLL